MSLTLDAPDVIVKPGRMVGGVGRSRLAWLAGLAVCLVGAMLLIKALYSQEVQLPRIEILAEDVGQLISRLHRLDQSLVEELDLLEVRFPPPTTHID